MPLKKSVVLIKKETTFQVQPTPGDQFGQAMSELALETLRKEAARPEPSIVTLARTGLSGKAMQINKIGFGSRLLRPSPAPTPDPSKKPGLSGPAGVSGGPKGLMRPANQALQTSAKAAPLQRSSILEIFDIPHDLLVASPENPNEQDEQTFDQVLEGMKRDGFDENIIVVPGMEGSPFAGKYIIVSGHHRAKAAKVLGLPGVPAKVHKNWDDIKRKLELVRRNKLRGAINPEKFTKLYDDIIKSGLDASVAKMQMGITNEKAFSAMYKSVRANLPPAAKAKLDEAKETITSVEDLSGAVNKIMKEHGSDLDHNFIVFSNAGKDHLLVQCDSELWKRVQSITADVRKRDVDMVDVFKKGLGGVLVSSLPASPKVAAKTAARK